MANSDTAALVKQQVWNLFALNPAYHQLAADKQSALAEGMIKVGTYLAEPEGIPAHQISGAIGFVAESKAHPTDFPSFVAGLIQGVFSAIVTASITQMKAYADLLQNVAETVDQFAKDNITDQQSRAWLVKAFPNCFDRDKSTRRLNLRAGRNNIVLTRFRTLPLPAPLKAGSASTAEDILVPAARRRLAAVRQQQLATMVLMGINR